MSELEDPLVGGAAINSASLGPERSFVAILCAFGAAVGAVVFGYSLGFSSPALPGMEDDVFTDVECGKDDAVTSALASLWSSIVNVGCMVGAIGGARLLDAAGAAALAASRAPFSGINAVIFFSGSILGSAGMANRDLGGCIIMAIQVGMTALSCVLMDRGRRTLLLTSLAGMALAAGAMALFFAAHLPPLVALAALVLYIAAFAGTFLLFALVCVAGAIYVAAKVPETKGVSTRSRPFNNAHL
ncbi:hypothetical protein JL720_5353 [Aureococcus anophagefferens]|nr:hypothetical protein JL720_5353 [Aureococcus anophagefferens]